MGEIGLTTVVEGKRFWVGAKPFPERKSERGEGLPFSERKRSVGRNRTPDTDGYAMERVPVLFCASFGSISSEKSRNERNLQQ